MRENRMSGSKGGEARLNAPFLPLSAIFKWNRLLGVYSNRPGRERWMAIRLRTGCGCG